jgi:hypothetical protein
MSVLKQQRIPRSPVSDDSSISEYLPRDSESMEVSDEFRRSSDKIENIYDNDSFYSVESDPSSSSVSKPSADAKRFSPNLPGIGIEKGSSLLQSLKENKNNETKQEKISDLPSSLGEASNEVAAGKPPTNRNNNSVGRGVIDFDALSESIQDIGDDLSSFQEELLKAGRSPRRGSYRTGSPEKAMFMDPNHPVAIGTDIFDLSNRRKQSKNPTSPARSSLLGIKKKSRRAQRKASPC